MQIQDLFSGAWVKNNSIPAQVTGLTCDGNLETTAYRYTNIERVEPIKLSPRVMSMIGFVEKDCDGEPLWSYEYKQYLVTFMSPNGCPSLTIEDVSSRDSDHNVLVVKDEIYNLHELQRAFMIFDIPCDFKLPKPF
jgi:hypothetical protein